MRIGDEFDFFYEQYWELGDGDVFGHDEHTRHWFEHNDDCIQNTLRVYTNLRMFEVDPSNAVRGAMRIALEDYRTVRAVFDFAKDRLFVTYKDIGVAYRPAWANISVSDRTWRSYILRELVILELIDVRRIRRPADNELAYDVSRHLGPIFKKYGFKLK